MTMERANPRFADKIKKLGAFDITACFSCGQCSAVCSLSRDQQAFPRRLIRYTLLGLEKRVLSAPEPWLCYFCGECSDSCPRQADPGGLMMALRRFAVRRYSLGRVSDMFSSAVASGLAWFVLTALALAAVIAFHNPEMNRRQVEFLSFISLEQIHIAGLVIAAFIVLAFAVNLFIMVRSLKKGLSAEALSVPTLRSGILPALRETVLQNSFDECENGHWRRWAHLGVSWGFMGMFLATAIISAVDFKWLPLPRWPSLVIGSIGGIAALAGLAYYFYLRIRRQTAYAKRSNQSDWAFLVLLGLSILSGFAMVALRFANLPLAAYWAFGLHLVVVFNLLIGAPFTKFAHIVYRPMALWLAGAKERTS
jgi:heterodisulfide reductase subunit C